MEDKNILDILKDIQEIVNDEKVEKDAEKSLKGNYSAGVRLRKKMINVKHYALEIRKQVQEIRNQNEEQS